MTKHSLMARSEESDATPDRHSPQAIAMGVSAGALDALSIILPALPRDFPLPVFVVVHLAPSKDSLLVELLRAKCKMEVCDVEDKEPIRSGTVFLAPPDYHLLIESSEQLSLSADEPVNFSRPSIDVLFESAADVYGRSLIGVVLTGANDDGARGLRAISAAGGIAVVQCPDEAYASAMPSSAVAACPTALVLGLEGIAEYLLEVGMVE